MKYIISIISVFICVTCKSSTVPEMESLVNISGYWKFSIGDDMDWSEKEFDDKGWDTIYTPGRWEDQGYVGYDGYAWYRLKINIPLIDCDNICLQLGRIDDVNQAYFNGVLVGQAGVFPPNFVSAYDAPLLYVIPRELIKFNMENTIAVRVYDEFGEGGFMDGKMMLGYNADIQLIDQDLAGEWKIAFNYKQKYIDKDYDDSHWDKILVPATWESQGYNDYNGKACYRKSFELYEMLADKTLYIILGKIDDNDQVYINGVLIGSTRDMYNTRFYNSSIGDWQIRRAYLIPSGLLKKNGKNCISVVVEDNTGFGGIYEGPVGLMTKENYSLYLEKYKVSRSGLR